jgi:hypothetical protein
VPPLRRVDEHSYVNRAASFFEEGADREQVLALDDPDRQGMVDVDIRLLGRRRASPLFQRVEYGAVRRAEHADPGVGVARRRCVEVVEKSARSRTGGDVGAVAGRIGKRN